MMNHKWDSDNVCVRCGITRKKKSWRLLMAITNHPPYDHYMRGRDWHYGMPDKDYPTVKAIGFKRPDCINQKTKP